MFCKMLLFLITLMMYSPAPEAANRRFNLELYNLSCVNPIGYLKRMECNLTKFGIGSYGMDMNFMLVHQMNNDVEVRIISLVGKGKRASVTSLDVTQNVCNLLYQTQNVPLTKKILDKVRKTSNFPRSCPVKKNVLYNLNNFSLNDDFFAAYLPTLKFNFSLLFYEHKKLLTKFELLGALVPKS